MPPRPDAPPSGRHSGWPWHAGSLARPCMAWRGPPRDWWRPTPHSERRTPLPHPEATGHACHQPPPGPYACPDRRSWKCSAGASERQGTCCTESHHQWEQSRGLGPAPWLGQAPPERPGRPGLTDEDGGTRGRGVGKQGRGQGGKGRTAATTRLPPTPIHHSALTRLLPLWGLREMRRGAQNGG